MFKRRLSFDLARVATPPISLPQRSRSYHLKSTLVIFAVIAATLRLPDHLWWVVSVAVFVAAVALALSERVQLSPLGLIVGAAMAVFGGLVWRLASYLF